MVLMGACSECRAYPWSAFACLTERQLARLSDARTLRAYDPGQPVQYEGNPALAVYCIRQGQIKIWRLGHSGEQLVIGTRGPGDLIGYRTAIARRPCPVTAEPLERSFVCAIPRETFMDLVNESAPLCRELLSRMAVTSLKTESRLLERAHDLVRQRVARYLVQLLPDGPEEARPPHRLVMSMGREDMAHLIGTTPETLSRTLRAFADRGILELDRQEIRVLDLDVLRRIAG